MNLPRCFFLMRMLCLAAFPAAAGNLRELAMVEQADGMLWANLEGIQQSAFQRQLRARAPAEAFPLQRPGGFADSFGIAEEEVLNLFLSFRLPPGLLDRVPPDAALMRLLDLSHPGEFFRNLRRLSPENAERLLLVQGLQLRRPVTLEGLRRTLVTRAGEGGFPQVETRSLAGRPVLYLREAPAGPNAAGHGLHIVLHERGSVLLAAVNERSLQQVLARLDGTSRGGPSRELEPLWASAPGREFRFALALPAHSRRELIAVIQSLSERDPRSAPVLAPFAGLRSAVLGGRFSETLDFMLETDLGNEPAALQASVLLNVLGPGLGGEPAVWLRNAPPQPDGSRVRFRGSLRPSDLLPVRQPPPPDPGLRRP